jgi:hypothetical protein
MRHTIETKVKTVQIKDEYVRVILTKEDIKEAIIDKVNDYLKSISYPRMTYSEISDKDIEFKDANSYPMKVEFCIMEILK